MKKQGAESNVEFPQTDFKVTVEFDDGTIYSGRAREGYFSFKSDYSKMSACKLEFSSWNEGEQKFGPLELTDCEIISLQNGHKIKKSLVQKLKRFILG